MEPNSYQQPAMQRISDLVLDAIVQKIKALANNRIFWTIMLILISIGLISWICLKDVSATKTILLPRAHQTIHVDKFLIAMPAQSKTTDKSIAFFEKSYDFLLVGRLDSDRIGMLGITNDGKTYSYEDKLDMSVMQKIKSISTSDNFVEIIVGRLWMETIVIIFLIAISAYVVILNILRRNSV